MPPVGVSFAFTVEEIRTVGATLQEAPPHSLMLKVFHFLLFQGAVSTLVQIPITPLPSCVTLGIVLFTSLSLIWSSSLGFPLEFEAISTWAAKGKALPHSWPRSDAFPLTLSLKDSLFPATAAEIRNLLIWTVAIDSLLIFLWCRQHLLHINKWPLNLQHFVIPDWTPKWPTDVTEMIYCFQHNFPWPLGFPINIVQRGTQRGLRFLSGRRSNYLVCDMSGVSLCHVSKAIFTQTQKSCVARINNNRTKSQVGNDLENTEV